MDWANDNACLSNSSADLKRIFKYSSRPCRVIRIVSQNDYEPQVWSLETPEEWSKWLREYTNGSGRGLIIVLANRTEGNLYCENESGPTSIANCLATSASAFPRPCGIRREATFAPLGEKLSLDSIGHDSSSQSLLPSSRSLRYLPFEQVTFTEICERFQIHKSIVRTLTRSDVPSFSCDDIDMNEKALVYNCRTSNSWDLDLALSATHYPQRGLTFAILFGSSCSIEKMVLERLQHMTVEAAHPLLLPGIFAELELVRHIRLVEASINEVETRIFELTFHSSKVRDNSRSEVERRSEAKRTAWLDLSYLRNSLISWNTQLLRMLEHAETLNRSFTALIAIDVSPEHASRQVRLSSVARSIETDARKQTIQVSSNQDMEEYNCRACSHTPQSQDSEHDVADKSHTDACLHERMEEQHSKRMLRIGEKIKVRLSAIRDEYDEKIRDCTMRVDGMAMATQWSQNETAVEIAVATNQDSKVMKSISLVTMVFLPGTFFATVFSMTFFNWSGDSGKARVSSYLWIYVVVTVCFTAITIGLWYFFVMFRRSGEGKIDEEKLRIE